MRRHGGFVQRGDDVVITGTGMLTHLGGEAQTLAVVREGKSRPIPTYQPAVDAGCRCTRVGLIPEDRLSDSALGVTRKEGRFLGPASRMALAAARDALVSAQWGDNPDLAVLVGSGAGDTAAHIETHERLLGGARRVKPTVVPRLMASTVSANLVHTLGTQGPSASVAAACAGGAWNIAVAAMMVRDGLCNAALAGGTECVDIHFHAGFDRMRAYCADADSTPSNGSRPYAADRAGFIFGEGAGMVILERRDQAEARGANIVAELCGWGLSSDGNREMVQPCADGPVRAMRAALRNAGRSADEVAYINTHATSTPAGDVEEVRALREVFGRKVNYSSTKGYTGHMVSAAGAVEAILTSRFLAQGLAPGCVNAEPTDPALADYPCLVSLTAIDGGLAMSNSFGFGGTNASLVIARP
ncbi:MAG: beta-ketoacyl synthase [Myxococcota bacterium]